MDEKNAFIDPRDLAALDALRAFEAAARHMSFKRAAAELALTPTAVSHRIRLLERRLGVRLFERRPRRVDLTAAGQGLYPALHLGFAAIARAVRTLRDTRAGEPRILSAPLAFASRWLLPRLARFAAAHPQTALHLHTSDVPADLQGGAAHLAVRYGPAPGPGLDSVPLLDSRFAPVCAPGCLPRGARDFGEAALIGFEWQRRDAATPDWPLWFERAGRPPRPVSLQFSDEGHAVQAAIAGHGVALLNLALVADELREGLLQRPFGPELPGHPFRLVWPQALAADAGVCAIRDWLLDEAGGAGSPAAVQ